MTGTPALNGQDNGQVTAHLYGGLPEADLATAHRVLATVAERAHAERAR